MQRFEGLAAAIEIDEVVRLARSPGEPVTPAAAEDNVKGALDVDVIPRRDEKGLDIILCPQNRSDLFRFIEEIGERTLLPCGLVVFSCKKGFGASDSGDIKQKAEMEELQQEDNMEDYERTLDDDNTRLRFHHRH